MSLPVDSPFFTVVVPTYNRAHLVLKTLDTVFAQTFQDFEILVVDNHSTDNIEEVLADLIQAGKIRFIRHDKNYERAKSRNTGMNNARGQYLTFLDSDDYMYPTALADAHQFATQHPDYRIFHNKYELVTPEGKHLYSYPAPSLADPLRAISLGNFFSCIGVFIHREVYNQIRFEEDPVFIGSEDYLYWLTVVGHFPKVGRVDKVNNGLVQHGGRTVNTIQTQEAFERRTRVKDKILAHPVVGKVYAPYRKLLERSAASFAAVTAMKFNDFSTARTYLWKAFRADASILFDLNFIKLLVRSLFGIRNRVEV
jgi:glycosyltransferase involved in cell wall biosynthesis